MSYGLYIGRNHTADGIAYLAGYGDEPSSHWLEVVPRQHHPVGAQVTVGVTPQADLAGRLSGIPQVPLTARHLRVSYSYYKGVPAPLTNGGLNEHGVAVRDIWSSSRTELVAMTPTDQSGPNYSDLARLDTSLPSPVVRYDVIVLDHRETFQQSTDEISRIKSEALAHGYSVIESRHSVDVLEKTTER